mgnify:CR=1 FL=1
MRRAANFEIVINQRKERKDERNLPDDQGRNTPTPTCLGERPDRKQGAGDKAEKSLDSLKALSSPHAKVLRDGKKMKIFSKEIVPGDILLLEAGGMIAADGRILDNYSLQVSDKFSAQTLLWK